MRLPLNLAILTWIATAGTSQASEFIGGISFGPFAGNGSFNHDTDIQYVSGFRGIFELGQLGSETTVVQPVMVLENSYVNARQNNGTERAILDYDNRTAQGGLTVSTKLENHPSVKLFGRMITGATVSKLSVDEASNSHFSQARFSGIRGRTTSVEMGSALAVQRDFELRLSAVYARSNLDQSKATGTEERESRSETGLTLTTRELRYDDIGLPQQSTLNSITANFSVNILF